jgi:NitT/TauT family transport system substrate-binding protein
MLQCKKGLTHAEPDLRRWNDHPYGRGLAGRVVLIRGGTKAESRTEFNIGWSIYAGWMPWPYAQQAGIVKKWADKYGVKINIVQVNDYVESVNQYTAGKLDGVTVANMDALTIPPPAARTPPRSSWGIIPTATTASCSRAPTIWPRSRDGRSISPNCRCRTTCSRAPSIPSDCADRREDGEHLGRRHRQRLGQPAGNRRGRLNPQLSVMKAQPNAKLVFDSSKIPGEILDLLVVDTATLKANPNLGKALTAIWYETTALMLRQDEQGKAAPARRWPSWRGRRRRCSTASWRPRTSMPIPRKRWRPPPRRR